MIKYYRIKDVNEYWNTFGWTKDRRDADEFVSRHTASIVLRALKGKIASSKVKLVSYTVPE